MCLMRNMNALNLNKNGFVHVKFCTVSSVVCWSEVKCHLYEIILTDHLLPGNVHAFHS